jgi:hypothetical protein
MTYPGEARVSARSKHLRDVSEGGSSAHDIQHGVYPARMGGPHGFDNIALGVVNGLSSAQAAEVLLVFGPGRGDDVGTQPRCHLDRETADTTGASHD